MQTWQLNLHVLMCASPAGDALRRMIRSHPSLVDCCHFDWYITFNFDAEESFFLIIKRYSEWPSVSLNDVVMHYIPTLPVEQVCSSNQIHIILIIILDDGARIHQCGR